MKKDEFMEKLLQFSRDDIRKFLESNGKPPKMIPLMVRVNNNK